MQIINNILDIKKLVLDAKCQNKTIGLVPTMGYLHEGHAALIKNAKESMDIVIVSIFVNPLQFNVQSDLANYPCDLERDIKLCTNLAVDVIFAPGVLEIYPSEKINTIVNVGLLDKNLCGRTRPGHFAGVCTVVAKLFHIIIPDMAFFGKKDIQQFRIIETMVEELNFNLKVIDCDTVRAKDGLALSSRNAHLSEKERKASLIVPRILQYVLNLIQKGLYDVKSILVKAEKFMEDKKQQANVLENVTIKVDYLEIVDYQNLQLLEKVQGKFIIATAIFIGNTRLIDNLISKV